MGKSQQSFNKKERENKKKKKAKDKLEKRLQRKAEKEAGGKKSFEDQLSYVDEFGNITDTPPDPTKKTEVKLEDIVIGVPARPQIDLNAEQTGKVKFFNSEKGFGFIDQDNGEDNIFVHINSVRADELKENQKVSYKIEKGDKGWVAVDVKIIG